MTLLQKMRLSGYFDDPGPQWHRFMIERVPYVAKEVAHIGRRWYLRFVDLRTGEVSPSERVRASTGRMMMKLARDFAEDRA